MTIVMTDRAKAAQQKARILQEALPWMTRWSGRTVVIKYGGNALQPAGAPDVTGPGEDPSFAADVALLHSVGVRVVVVHGGGPQISALADRLGLETAFVDGKRVTDAPTLQAVQMALLGQVNPMLVRMISDAGAAAVGVSGTDSGLVTATTVDDRLGLVGEVDRIDPTYLDELLDSGRVPVMATLCQTTEGTLVNVNADTVAGALAVALRADKLIYLTNVAGLYDNFGTPDSTLLSEVSVARLEQMLADDELVTGMIPKISSIVTAVHGGVPQAHLLDGRIEHALLLEIFTDEGIGTMVEGTAEVTATANGGPQ
ncbi:acetylglutamate kinase [Euzebya tangerina]|uniref:acetylglutamate kinase n=1 Tax=Euzebya tangerina TaxID=591198 RepID=UPI00196B1774|nr:acetylglutamate kinase [Euzebya tangerina]